MDKQMDKQMKKNQQSNKQQQMSDSCKGCRKKQQLSNKLGRQQVHENTDEFCN
ncbi:MAG: hypothetical protein IJC70_07250 [Firmicutes bacterium]|nr:hypothetical protein [Bacillota bacterium]MBR6823682.1 hypothetical protein [Bacillota bacterium]